ncbi:MAG: hypothetical protein U1E05_03250 [Patescibacteria group bacterium]|nr:hypothetical protein [Patescibacteria group bacterium]
MQRETNSSGLVGDNPPFASGRLPARRRTTHLALCLACIAAAVVMGCGRGSSDRVVVTGMVTYRGEPLPSGRIHFAPAEGTKAPQSGAEIVDGKYTVDANGGVPHGTHKIRITAQRVDPKYAGIGDSVPSDFQDVGGPPMQQYLPEKYNVRTELEITIQPGTGRITKAFDLVD